MKQGIHPAYGPVAFRDRSTGRVVVTRSTLVNSHPFWTGKTRTLDVEGRVLAFERRYGRKA